MYSLTSIDQTCLDQQLSPFSTNHSFFYQSSTDLVTDRHNRRRHRSCRRHRRRRRHLLSRPEATQRRVGRDARHAASSMMTSEKNPVFEEMQQKYF